MTFNQVNYFLEVADQLNFTKAAASMFVTQSTLSRSIAALENELCVTLLKRDFHAVSLTSAGEIFYKEMKPIMHSINTVIHRVQAAGDEATDQFVLGILEGHSVASNILFAIRNLSDKFPNLNVDIRRTYHSKLIEDLLSYQLNIAQTIISDSTVLDDGLDCLPLRYLNYYLLAQKTHPILSTPFTIESLQGQTLIVPDNIHPGLIAAIHTLKAAGITIKIKKGLDLETQSLWMEAGMGVYIGSDDSVIYTSRSFRPINAIQMEELPPIQQVLVWNKSYVPPILEDFLSFIRMNMNQEGAELGSVPPN